MRCNVVLPVEGFSGEQYWALIMNEEVLFCVPLNGAVRYPLRSCNIKLVASVFPRNGAKLGTNVVAVITTGIRRSVHTAWFMGVATVQMIIAEMVKRL
jgi:hypothetical protein